MNKTALVNNYFEQKALIQKIGAQDSTHISAQAYRKLTEALEAMGEALVSEYPKLENHAKVIGYTRISKKMIKDYK